MAIYPTPEQIRALLAGPDDQPVVMVNLLRFKPQADGGGPSGGAAYRETGEASYQRYATAMRAVVEAAGGRFLWPATSTPW